MFPFLHTFGLSSQLCITLRPQAEIRRPIYHSTFVPFCHVQHHFRSHFLISHVTVVPCPCPSSTSLSHALVVAPRLPRPRCCTLSMSLPLNFPSPLSLPIVLILVVLIVVVPHTCSPRPSSSLLSLFLVLFVLPHALNQLLPNSNILPNATANSHLIVVY